MKYLMTHAFSYLFLFLAKLNYLLLEDDNIPYHS